MGIVPMDHVLCARRIRHLDYATLLAGVVREIDREQFLHVDLRGWARSPTGCGRVFCRAGARHARHPLSMHRIDLTRGAVHEKECVYMLRRESLTLRSRTSIGRLDISDSAKHG
jgi:hypothetical protein